MEYEIPPIDLKLVEESNDTTIVNNNGTVTATIN